MALRALNERNSLVFRTISKKYINYKLPYNILMLTIHQLVKLYEEGVNIHFKEKPSPKGFKGEYDPSSLEILIYTPAIESKSDEDLTILHEFVHARDDIYSSKIAYIQDTIQYEQETEQEALKTYKKRPYLLDFIMQLYFI